MIRTFIIAAASAAVLTLSPTAFAQQPGQFGTADEAILEGYRRFGLVRMMLQEIRDPDTPDFVSLVDPNHPSCKRID